MYEWIPVTIVAFLVSLGIVGETLESDRLTRLREDLEDPPSFPGMAC